MVTNLRVKLSRVRTGLQSLLESIRADAHELGFGLQLVVDITKIHDNPRNHASGYSFLDSISDSRRSLLIDHTLNSDSLFAKYYEDILTSDGSVVPNRKAVKTWLRQYDELELKQLVL